jgi:lipooligosaccharide transport system permease protein
VIEALARLNPLYHCVQLVRDVVVLGIEPLADLGHFAFLLAFGLALWRIAIWRMRKRLID